MPMLLLFTLILYAWAYQALVFGESTNYRREVGKNQYKLYDTYNQADKAIIYLDNAARLAAYDSLKELGENGGYVNEQISECSKAGYNLWYNAGEECWPDIQDNFKTAFKKNFNKYLANYNIRLHNDYDNPGLKDYYDYLTDINKDGITINGKSRSKYIFGTESYSDGRSEFLIKYEVDPSFNVKIDIGLSDYNEIKLAITDAIRLCNNAECFDRNVRKGNYSWRIFDKDDYVLFEVNTGKKIFNEDLVIKFAVKKK